MKVSFAFVTLLAGWAMATPAAVGNLEARVDCSTCGCSSSESCTFDVSPCHAIIDSSDYPRNANSGGGSSAVRNTDPNFNGALFGEV
ncbi:hypothetical protein F5Y13DRAFT_188050 [Hypoxylon sp. FL1857]|nr:hypothetical protein F5Y13DRAFT_188050 [Hypoxylon sp. FL1857]